MIRVLYFAWLRERLGLAEEAFALPAGITSVAGLLGVMHSRFPAVFAEGAKIRCAVNQEIVGPEAAIAPGDEVAFFPPVTGG